MAEESSDAVCWKKRWRVPHDMAPHWSSCRPVVELSGGAHYIDAADPLSPVIFWRSLWATGLPHRLHALARWLARHRADVPRHGAAGARRGRLFATA